MSRNAARIGLAVLVLAGAGTCLRSRLTPSTPGPRGDSGRTLFPTVEDARRYALARLEATQGTAFAGDPYSSTFTRRLALRTGATLDYYLVESPARELELAEGFLKHGFGREALAHLDTVITFHPGTPEADRARARIEEFRQSTVLGLVWPLSSIVADAAGFHYVPASVAAPSPPTLERIQEAWLGSPVRLEGPLTVIGTVDEAGQFLVRKEDGGIEPDVPPARFESSAPGISSRERLYYRIRKARSVFELEADAKRELLETMGGSALSDPGRLRRIADAYLYAGLQDQAAALAARACLPPVDPAASTLPSALGLDTLWTQAAEDHPSFTLTTASSVTTGEAIPLKIESRAIREMKFSLARYSEPIPAQERELKDWLSKAPTMPSQGEILGLSTGKSELRLPIREPGAYRVTAEARGLSCSFLAVRTDLAIEMIAMPGETLFSAGREGVTVASPFKVLGTTEKDGLLSFQGGVLGRFCDEHRQCCANCESCLHHHTDEAVVASGARVFVSGHGQFFRATAKIDSGEVAKLRPPPPAPILLVYTDRPAYKAGDTLRFRGVLRVPRQPLKRSDSVRLEPSPEREVALSIRCGDASLFQRTYVTGEYGTFSGEFTIPLSASRAEYTIEVGYADAKVGQSFQVLDYRKSDYSIVLTPLPAGFRIEAGYVWGTPVVGARLSCQVGGNEVPVKDGVVPMKEGERLTVRLLRDSEELAQKSVTFRARPAAPQKGSNDPAGAGPAGPEPAAPPPALEPPKAPVFTVTPSKSLYRRGEMIELELQGPWDQAQALVVLGDSQLYDLVRVPLEGGRGLARIPARSVYDPGVAIFAICNGIQAQAEVQVRTCEMAVSIEAPAQARPGDRVEVLLRADPGAALSLAAVDEAIYMIAEDQTPEMYAHFYPPRPAAIAWGRCEGFEYDGETHRVDRPIEGPNFRTGDAVRERLARRAGIFGPTELGLWGGGRYGRAFGGRENLVARAGGAAAATDSACLAGLRALGRHQKADGSWGSTAATPAGTLTDPGATALAVLSFLGAGYSQLSRDEVSDPARPGTTLKFGEIVKKGTQWLHAHQSPAGWIGPESGDALVNHALAALVLSEGYGMTLSAPLKDPAQKAIDALVLRQSNDGGWHASDPKGPGQILPTVIAVLALKSAQLSELTFPLSAAERTWQFLGQAVDDDGTCGSPATRSTVGGALVAQLFLRQDRSEPRLGAAAAWLLEQKPHWSQGDPLGWYLASLGLFQFDGPGGPAWKQWNEHEKNALVPNQSRDGLWTVRNESIVATALATLTLEVYYRYANVFGGSGGKGAALPLAGKPRLRVYFPDTAFWAPELVADPRGEARVSFTLPDQITTTRLTARGITKDSALGQATARISARQPFFVKVLAPEVAVLGDEIDVRVEAWNYTRSDMEASIWLEGEPGARTLQVPQDRPASASWRIRAADPAGLRLVAHGRSGEREDSMERVVPVRRVAREETVVVRGEARTGQSFSFQATPETQDVVVQIHPRQSSLSQILDALRYLNAYPYG
ncbi:MAG TPA: alpha-2-macroglobulin family protein [Planctomycetota bacterium]|nr:alpha-2-macroglobulin family protein [Planctomycetota bacterium]